MESLLLGTPVVGADMSAMLILIVLTDHIMKEPMN